jgi:hypothetical protein
MAAVWRMYRVSGVWSYATGSGFAGSSARTASYSRRNEASCYFV